MFFDIFKNFMYNCFERFDVMNIYNLNKEELKNARKEFVKTSFGSRIATFGCLLPLLLMLVSFILMLGEFFCMILDEGTGNFYLVFIIASINLVGACVTMLMHEKMFMNFVEKKTDKK